MSSRLCMTWTTLSCDLRALDVMNNSRLWIICSTLGRELKTGDALNSSTLWVIWMTQDPMFSGLKIIWAAQGCRWYEWFCVMSSRLCTTWMTPSREVTTPDTMNNLRFWVTWTTSSCELRALKAMKSLELWMIWMTLDPVSLGLKMLWTPQG